MSVRCGEGGPGPRGGAQVLAQPREKPGQRALTGPPGAAEGQAGSEHSLCLTDVFNVLTVVLVIEELSVLYILLLNNVGCSSRT